MERRWYLIAGGVVVAAIAVALLAGFAAGSRVQAESAAWDDAVHQATVLGAGLERLPVSRAGAPQPDQVANLGRRMLVAAGIGQQSFAGIQPLGDTPLPGGSWHRQQVLLQLRGLSTAQVAAVVEAARQVDPAWAVGSVQLSHVSGGNDTYDAGISLVTLYPAAP